MEQENEQKKSLDKKKELQLRLRQKLHRLQNARQGVEDDEENTPFIIRLLKKCKQGSKAERVRNIKEFTSYVKNLSAEEKFEQYQTLHKEILEKYDASSFEYKITAQVLSYSTNPQKQKEKHKIMMENVLKKLQNQPLQDMFPGAPPLLPSSAVKAESKQTKCFEVFVKDEVSGEQRPAFHL